MAVPAGCGGDPKVHHPLGAGQQPRDVGLGAHGGAVQAHWSVETINYNLLNWSVTAHFEFLL